MSLRHRDTLMCQDATWLECQNESHWAKAPFRVHKHNGRWWLSQRVYPRLLWEFGTPGAAIDYAYRHWPWWP